MNFQNCVMIRCISSENMTVVWNVKNVRNDQCKVNSICKAEKQKKTSESLKEKMKCLSGSVCVLIRKRTYS